MDWALEAQGPEDGQAVTEMAPEDKTAHGGLKAAEQAPKPPEKGPIRSPRSLETETMYVL